MANFAVLSGTSIANLIVAETKEDAELVTQSECIEYTDENPASIGWTYADGVFTAPVVETPAE
jgi:hypothetical protein